MSYKPHCIFPSLFPVGPQLCFACFSHCSKARLSEALARVESLEREKRSSMLRERMAKKNVHALLEDLREKNLMNEEVKDRLECYSGKMEILI